MPIKWTSGCGANPVQRSDLWRRAKNWLDLEHALSLLNIDAAEADRIGVTTYKVAQTWPLDIRGFEAWAEGLDLIVVVEEKRKLIEVQIKEALFDNRAGRRVMGGTRDGAPFFSAKWALDPIEIALKLGGLLLDEGRHTDGIVAGLAALEDAQRADNAEDIAARLPYFCSGCPHNASTKVPEGSRAYAGIGCHFMAQWMDRETLGFTHMGGEGANWIGEAPFSTRNHVFQNIGDGTYNHSGIQAIRAAVSAGTNITYKILYNDAVAMTGGQGNDGGLTASRIVQEVRAMGVETLAVVYDDKEDIDLQSFKGVDLHERADLQTVQEKFAKISGVSVIVYIQTCAAEKRRRRKRAGFSRIRTSACSSIQMFAKAVVIVVFSPIAFPSFREKRNWGANARLTNRPATRITAVSKGFCPSFVTLEGARIRKEPTVPFELPDLPPPDVPQIENTWNIVITGVGGTGVVTIGAILAQAAFIDGKGAGVMEMAGLAQKGGAVHIHCRIADRPEHIKAIRVSTGEAHALIGGDLMVSAGAKTLGLTSAGRTGAVVNNHEIITGDFTRDTEFRLPSERLTLALEARLQSRLDLFDASELARVVLGDSIFSNMMMLGAAWQKGYVPLTEAALRQAIELNGAAVEKNLRAFDVGRWAVLHGARARALTTSNVVALPKTEAEQIAFRVSHLTAYQNKRLARRYLKLLDRIEDGAVKAAALIGYHKLLSYKDEYEVARLLISSREKAQAEFEGDFKLSFNLAPPLLSRTGARWAPPKARIRPVA